MDFSGGILFNAGYEMWAMDMMVRFDRGYIAIGGRRYDDENTVHRFNEGQDGNSFIQVLSFTVDGGVRDIELAQTLAHDHGSVRDLQWAIEPSNPSKIGNLAACFENGLVQVFEVLTTPVKDTATVAQILSVPGKVLSCVQWSPHQRDTIIAGDSSGECVDALSQMYPTLHKAQYPCGISHARPCLYDHLPQVIRVPSNIIERIAYWMSS